MPNHESVGRTCDDWLIPAGLLYAAVTFGAMLCGGGRMGPLAFSILHIPMAAMVAVSTVVALWANGVRFRWWAVALFVAWVAVVVVMQVMIYAAASAAV